MSMRMDPSALSVRGVAKRYGRRRVLNDVSFDVAPGEVVGVTGENGAGKSTLLRIVVGLLRPDRGEVRYRDRLGYCGQETLVFPDLTVAEHFRYLGRAYGLCPADERRVRDVLLEWFRFGQYLDVRVRELSGGTQQKLHLALALLHEPTVLVLDEPYQSFDWETYLRFWDYVDDVRRRGVAVLIVTHLAHELARFDRVLELEEGRIRCESAMC
jgi:ABC-2 type transport system ATP-binding protein